ncbi:MAG TPA: hypothetical protein VJJ79_02760 [Candidatus Nanoarchaeia archaeon]|nr:hypothetical protein [Candidatus Nanoarchaeia archaeon]
MAKEGFPALFSSPEEKEKTEEEKWKEKEQANPFIQKKSLDPENGVKALKISIDSIGDTVEKHYFFFQKFLTKHPTSPFGLRAEEIIKLKDVFDASVSSAFHGQIGSKVSAIQQQISTYLTQIGQLTKTIFPMVREIRMMDERLEFYTASLNKDKGDEEARQNEVALKSIWVEVVEQGMQNPNSVYSMATKLGFVTLPDLFFGINPAGKTSEEQKKNLTKILDALQKEKSFSLKVRNALEKKLVQYYTWKDKTWNEMHHTRKFRIKALKQHYNVIRLYVSWLKPYLTALKALQLRGDITAPELVAAFETSKLELELLAVMKKGEKFRSCVLVRITYVTRPELTYGQGGGKQVTHVGEVTISIEPYVATQEEIEFYKTYTERSLFQSMSGVESATFVTDVEAILTSLGEDVQAYLKEAEEGKKEEKKENKEQREGILDPFAALGKSFKMFFPQFKKKERKGLTKKEMIAGEKEKKEMEKDAAAKAWVLYEVFKKSNGMLTW